MTDTETAYVPPVLVVRPRPDPFRRALYVQARSCTTEADTAKSLDLAARIGVDTVIYAAYYGRAYYDSDIMPVQMDALAGVMKGAQARGLRVWAWLPCAYMAWGSHPEWNAKNNHDDIDENWLDFEVPEVRTYLAAAYTEIVDRYDVDGVLLDYIRWRSSWWQTADLSPEHISLTVREVWNAVYAVRRVNVAASVYRSRRDCRHARQHWWEWLAGGYLDVASPMAYTSVSGLRSLVTDWTESGWFPSRVRPSLKTYIDEDTPKSPARMADEFAVCADAQGLALFDDRHLARAPELVEALEGGW